MLPEVEVDEQSGQRHALDAVSLSRAQISINLGEHHDLHEQFRGNQTREEMSFCLKTIQSAQARPQGQQRRTRRRRSRKAEGRDGGGDVGADDTTHRAPAIKGLTRAPITRAPITTGSGVVARDRRTRGTGVGRRTLPETAPVVVVRATSGDDAGAEGTLPCGCRPTS